MPDDDQRREEERRRQEEIRKIQESDAEKRRRDQDAVRSGVCRHGNIIGNCPECNKAQ